MSWWVFFSQVSGEDERDEAGPMVFKHYLEYLFRVVAKGITSIWVCAWPITSHFSPKIPDAPRGLFTYYIVEKWPQEQGEMAKGKYSHPTGAAGKWWKNKVFQFFCWTSKSKKWMNTVYTKLDVTQFNKYVHDTFGFSNVNHPLAILRKWPFWDGQRLLVSLN